MKKKVLLETLGESAQYPILGADEKTPIADLCESLVALANGDGGILIVGWQDDKLQGISESKQIQERIVEASLKLDPVLITELPEVKKVATKDIITVTVPKQLPWVYGFDGKYLIYADEKAKPLAPMQLRELILKRNDYSFEAGLVHGATKSDIDWELANEYVQKINTRHSLTTEQLLLQNGCLVKQGDAIYPTIAGILLFGKKPQQFIRNADISAVRFSGEKMSDQFERQDIRGTLIHQVKRVQVFLADHLRKQVKLDGNMARAEVYEYPMEAARELIINAVAHRDYSIEGDNIRLFIFQNRMEVSSPGALPGHVTLENIKDERFSRNPIIVQVLADYQYIERLGYGVDRIYELMTQHQLATPLFEENGGTFKVTLTKSETLSTEKSVEEKPLKPSIDHVIVNGHFRGVLVNPRQQVAIKRLHEGDDIRITNSELKNLFEEVHPETIRRDLADLVNKGVLLKLGQKRGSYYILADEKPKDNKPEDKNAKVEKKEATPKPAKDTPIAKKDES